MEKASLTSVHKEKQENLLEMLNDIVANEIICTGKPLKEIGTKDIREALKKIQKYEFAAPFAPLGNLEDLAEQIQPEVENILKTIPDSYKNPAEIKRLDQKKFSFTGKEFGLNPKGTKTVPHPGFQAQRRLAAYQRKSRMKSS
jgi:hypothetical protein